MYVNDVLKANRSCGHEVFMSRLTPEQRAFYQVIESLDDRAMWYHTRKKHTKVELLH